VAFGALRKEIGPVPFALFAFYEVSIGWLALFSMVMHFPDGEIYPLGATPWIYPLFGAFSLLGVFIFLSNTSIYAGLANPFRVPALQKLNEFITWLTILIGSPVILMAVVSPVLRYRKGSPLERQQIKWLALFGGILSLGTILGFIVYPLITGGEMFNREDNFFSLLFFFSMGLFPPLAIGFAVLRYRLWDVDIIIRRTLVYSILTVLLTLVYFGSVVLLQELFQLITGEHQSPVATVLSTLAIAALFTPLRRGIQEKVDRRFYRKKYDAERVLAAFNATLRNEVDLDHLKDSILGVVEETMQPAHASLWLREVKTKPVSGRNASQTLG
jgi:hypothetical protein